MSSAEQQLVGLIEAVQQTYMVNLAAAAALTWLAYEIIHTMVLEISHVWKAEFTIHKVLYYVVRYWTLYSMIFTLAVNTNTSVPLHFCRHWFWYRAITGPLVITTAGEALFLIRIYAIYGRSRKILCLIVPLYLAQFVGGLVSAILEVGSISATPRSPGFPIPGCLATLPQYAQLNYMSWGISMVASCVYFLLTLYKFVISLYPPGSRAQHPSIFELRHLAPIFYLFIRDGTFYFFVVFVSNLLNLIFTGVLANSALEQMGTAWLMATYGVTSCRLYLNLRNSVANGGQLTSWNDIELRDRSISRGMVFAREANSTMGSDTVMP